MDLEKYLSDQLEDGMQSDNIRILEAAVKEFEDNHVSNNDSTLQEAKELLVEWSHHEGKLSFVCTNLNHTVLYDYHHHGFIRAGNRLSQCHDTTEDTQLSWGYSV